MAADFVVPESFVFERVGEHRYRFDAVAGADPGYVIFGGQLLAQMLLASAASVPAKALKSIQALFVRGGDVSEAVDISDSPEALREQIALDIAKTQRYFALGDGLGANFG